MITWRFTRGAAALLLAGLPDSLLTALPSAALRTLEGHKGSIQSVAFAPNGAPLATGSSDDTVGLWMAR